jgi:TRAP transporter 4TM/12TM fusion protein
VRELNRPLTLIAKAISALFAFFYLYTAGFGIFSSESHRGFYLLFSFLLCFLFYPAAKKAPYNRALLVLDGLLILLSTAAIVYWMDQYGDYASYRVAYPNVWDTFWGSILILICLEVTRRVMGNTLAIVGLLFVVQLYFGPHLPGAFAHRGMTITRIIEFNYSTTEGIFGTVVSVFSTYVMPFLVFGAFLQRSGGGDFFIDLAKALAGRISGGPALIAVWGSAVFGSMSGSPVANVVATGSFTIPMMKKAGFKPEFAGAVEAAASTGGQFLPPIMGAAAFILATLTETTYAKICIMASVPALLYYFSLTSMVYFNARKTGIRGLQKEDLPRVSEVLRKGWYYAFTIVIAVYLIVVGFSPPVVAFWATIFVTACSMLRKETRFTPARIFDTLDSAGKSGLSVAATAGTLGLVMGGITLSGLGVTFSHILLSLSGGSIFATILLIMFISTIVGMGLPTTASYIVMAILAAPSLVLMGVPPVQAHMLCFWLSMTSNITPPVCVAAFAGASISGGDPMKTGLHACALGAFLYLLPFAFVYTPEVMLIGKVTAIIPILVSFLFATIALSAAIQGWFMRRLALWERAVYLVSSILLIIPELFTDLAGLAILALMILRAYRTRDGLTGAPGRSPVRPE